MSSTLWALARRLVPLHVMRQKIVDYVECGYIDADERDVYIETLEHMHGVIREYNVHATSDAQAASAPRNESAP